MVTSKRIQIKSGGNCEIIDITQEISRTISESDCKDGIVTVFVAGSTAGVTTVEYEPGLVSDLQAAFERLAPQGIPYGHDQRWGDGNGHSHVRASLLGASLVIPFTAGQPELGTWQQIVVIDFDNRPRTRPVILQIMGE
ncbi:MAG: secondary thiamine-phosphate synthase enzyme YjbQ [Chloroflexota bacterium]|nr:secondary thiamine-phosphate synthase enzyme YjbQ [Chloroflexota bacterium]